MSALRRFVNLFRRRALERELDAEVQFHLEARIANGVRAGLTRAEAEAEARAAFGDVGRVTEVDAGGADDDAARIARSGSALRRPVAGPRAAVDGRRRGDARPWHRRQRRHLHAAQCHSGCGRCRTGMPAAWSTLEDSFARAGHRPRDADGAGVPGRPRVEPIVRDDGVPRSPRPAPHRGRGADARLRRPRHGLVLPAARRQGGARASLHRSRQPAGARAGGACCRDGLWRRAFGADPAIVGRTIQIDRRPHQIVGVLPAGFEFDHPAIGIREPADVYVPFLMDQVLHVATGQPLASAARAGAGAAAAGVALDAAACRDAAARRAARPGASRAVSQPCRRVKTWASRCTLRPLQEAVAGETRTVLLLLLACVAMVLLIACANTVAVPARAGAAAARRSRRPAGARRQPRTARAAVPVRGAGPRRAGHGVLGLAAAQLFVRGFVALVPTTGPLLARAAVDGTVLAFAAALASLSAMSCSACCRPGRARMRRSVSCAPAVSRRSRAIALVAVEVALSMVAARRRRPCSSAGSSTSAWPRAATPAEHVTVLQLRLTQPRPELQPERRAAVPGLSRGHPPDPRRRGGVGAERPGRSR